MDLTEWDFATQFDPAMPSCASCHPGGGGMEYDRQGNRYDQYLAAHPELAKTPDGDYYQSEWDKSGVLEADCLLCHLPNYSWSARMNQLANYNLKWAATVGAGLGEVQGSVRAGQVPVVTYNLRLFNQDGTVSLNIVKSPPDANCLQCHGFADTLKRGLTWNDPQHPDVHNAQGISCVSCHPSGIDHNFAKGNTPTETVRNDLDNTMKSCQDCHSTGYLGATIAMHYNIPASHLQTIACETCHIPSLAVAGRKILDISTGAELQLSTVPGTPVGAPGQWMPDYVKESDGKIHPVNRMILVWFGNRNADGHVVPLFLKEIQPACDLVKGQVRDDNGDGLPDVNTDAEITAMLKALTKTLVGNPRVDKIDPVYVKDPYLYSLDGNGQLTKEDVEAAGVEAHANFAISHDVAAPGQALGAGGCKDCHAPGSQFFFGPVMLDPWNSSGQPTMQTRASELGISNGAATFLGFAVATMRPWWGILLLLVLLAVVLHFVVVGPHWSEAADPAETGTIERFAWSERLVHLAILVSFVLLAITGLSILFGWGRLLDSLFGSTGEATLWHSAVGIVFFAGVLFMAIRWWRDGLLAKTDWGWLRHFGGYLGYHGELPPQGRFNAGQKLYFWGVILGGLGLGITGVLLILRDRLPLSVVFVAGGIHIILAVIGVAAVIGHAYLGTFANPGTIQAMFTGKVTRAWAKLHHGGWFASMH